MIGFVRDQIEMKDVYINEGSGGGGISSIKILEVYEVDRILGHRYGYDPWNSRPDY